MKYFQTKKSKIIVSITIIMVLAIGYYLLSPLWRDKELNEAFPVSSGLETMSRETRAHFEEEMRKTITNSTSMSDDLPLNFAMTKEANLIPKAHDVRGKVLLVEQDGRKVLRFEGLDTTNGPDLRIYLSAGPNDKDFVDLGAIKANKGNINYDIPPGTDTEKYRYALIWCRAFKVLFSYAEFN